MAWKLNNVASIQQVFNFGGSFSLKAEKLIFSGNYRSTTQNNCITIPTVPFKAPHVPNHAISLPSQLKENAEIYNVWMLKSVGTDFRESLIQGSSFVKFPTSSNEISNGIIVASYVVWVIISHVRIGRPSQSAYVRYVRYQYYMPLRPFTFLFTFLLGINTQYWVY